MNITVIYDSVFGNTKKVSEEIAKAINSDVNVINVSDFDSQELNTLDFIIIGSPTRGFKPTKGIVELLKKISKLEKILKVACFDTRIHISNKDPWILRKLVKKFGYAIDSMSKILSKNNLLDLHESNYFYVSGTEGPLHSEELNRAFEWAKDISK
mgnify:CR=1 FL=1